MKAIVTTTTDSTNVYGYLDVQPMTDDGVPVDNDKLPKRIQQMMREQYPSTLHAAKHLEEPAVLLRKLGWTVLDHKGDPWLECNWAD